MDFRITRPYRILPLFIAIIVLVGCTSGTDEVRTWVEAAK